MPLGGGSRSVLGSTLLFHGAFVMTVPFRDVAALPEQPMRPELWREVTTRLNLSPRQARLVELLLLGLQDKDIIDELGIKLPTLRTHLDRLCRRVGARGRVQLVVRIMAIAIMTVEERHQKR